MTIVEGVDLDAMTSYDTVSEFVFDQSDDGDTHALAENETFDWGAIEHEHSEHARAWLAERGISWDPDTGQITHPDALADQVASLWDTARNQAEYRVLDLIDEIREGKPDDGAQRTTGHVWVKPL